MNLNKPFGLTSHDCVAQVRRLLKQKRVGHGGTLDPAATGVLPIAVGKATRLLQYLSHQKAYRAKIRFGVVTTTDDLEGETLTQVNAAHLTLAQVQPLLSQFVGKIEQIPPSYSAIQVGGKRLYELARAGEPIAAPVRTVEIYKIEIINWHCGEQPELEIAIDCGPGTYIRSIARDLGAELETGGTLAGLVRTASSGFQLIESLTLEQLKQQLQAASFDPVTPTAALQHIPALTIAPDQAKRWRQGQRLHQTDIAAQAVDFASIYQIRQLEGDFLGIGQVVETPDERWIAPKLVWDGEN